ncbi:MAG: hypothetical protein AAEJ52_11025 [Myxococcota bacterium]
MEALATQRWQELRDWLVPERPCSLITWHVLVTGIGRCWVDSLSQPRCAIAFAGGNLTLAGDAEALADPARWPRVIFTTDVVLSPEVASPPGELRRLGAADAAAVEALEEDIQWISDTLGGRRKLADCSTAFGGFVDGGRRAGAWFSAAGIIARSPSRAGFRRIP